MPCCDKQSLHRPARRRGTGRPPDSVIKASLPFPTLEGCGPSQPRIQERPYVGPIPCCGETKLASTSTAPRDRTPSRFRDQSFLAVPAFGGLRSLAAADPIKTLRWAHALLRQTKLAPTSTAPRDRTPSRFRDQSFLAVPDFGGLRSGLRSLAAADPIKTPLKKSPPSSPA